jgi:hypothetical protein
MASIGSLLTGTPATLNADLLPSDVGVYVDSLNGLRGTVSVASGGAGIGVAVAGQNVNVSNTGVTSLVAGTGMTVSAGTGAVTVATTALLKRTALTYSADVVRDAAPLPAGPPASTVVNFGAPFVAPATGLYLVEVSAGFDVDAVNTVSMGAQDSIAVGIKAVGNPGTGLYFKPWSVPAGADNDYGVAGTTIALLTEGVSYQPYYESTVFDGSTLPNTTFAVEILSLCS